MRKFNIGDKIKVTGNCNGHGYEIGREYTIKCFDSRNTESNENGYAYNLDTCVIGDIIREKDMELVKPKEPVLFMNPNDLEVKCQNITVGKYQTQIDCYNKIFNKEEYDRYVKGEWKDMKNEVLELWYTRKRNKIIKEYEEKEIEFYESIELVVKYNDIVDRFENELKELYESEENVENKYIRDALSSDSMYKYKINHEKLRDEFVEKYISERDEKINELNDLKKEIDAQLSLSNDAEYQIDVLIRYGILDKKTKKMVN